MKPAIVGVLVAALVALCSFPLLEDGGRSPPEIARPLWTPVATCTETERSFSGIRWFLKEDPSRPPHFRPPDRIFLAETDFEPPFTRPDSASVWHEMIHYARPEASHSESHVDPVFRKCDPFHWSGHYFMNR